MTDSQMTDGQQYFSQHWDTVGLLSLWWPVITVVA